MPDPTDDIDLSSLGTFTPDHPRGEESPEAPEAEKAPEPAPEKEPEKAPEKPKPKDPDPEAEEAEEDEFEEMTPEDIEAIVNGALEKRDKAAAEAAEDDDTPQEVKDLRAENERLRAENEEREKALEERERQDALKALEHSIGSTVGKYKMTDDEVKATITYMKGNPDLVQGGMGFEEAATRRLPEIKDRLRTSPPPPKQPRGEEGSDGLLGAPGAGGPAAPKPWKHTVQAGGGDYSDISNHMLATGEAGSLGKYT